MTLIEIFESITFLLMLWLTLKNHQSLNAIKEDRRNLEILREMKND